MNDKQHTMQNNYTIPRSNFPSFIVVIWSIIDQINVCDYYDLANDDDNDINYIILNICLISWLSFCSTMEKKVKFFFFKISFFPFKKIFFLFAVKINCQQTTTMSVWTDVNYYYYHFTPVFVVVVVVWKWNFVILKNAQFQIIIIMSLYLWITLCNTHTHTHMLIVGFFHLIQWSYGWNSFFFVAEFNLIQLNLI